MKDVTGLNFTTNNTKGKAIAQFRGSDADNTKIFIDGVPLSPVGDGKVDLSAIPTDNIAKIEVIKGAVPVIYGTDAPGGIIYITTKKAGDRTVKSLTYTTGTDNNEKYYVSVDGTKNKLSYSYGAKREETEGYTVHSQIKANYFTGKLGWDINPKSSLTVFGSYSEKEQQMPNRIDPVTAEIILNQGQGGPYTGRNNYWSNSCDWEYDPVKNSYIGALYNYKLNAKSDLSFKVYRSNETSHLKGWKWAAGAGTGEWLYQDWDGTVQGWELQHTIRTSRVNTTTWGYAYEKRNFSEQTSYYGHADYDYTGKSFYIQDVTNVNHKLSTNFGFRHYENEDHANINTLAYANPGPQHGTGMADDPVFSFNYALSSTTNFHGSIGKSFRWPNAKERSGPGGYYIGSCTSAFSNGNGNGTGDTPSNMIVQKLPSYSAVDLKVGKSVGNRDYYVRILNMFDRKYYQGAYLVAPGRYIEVGTTIKF